MKALFYVSSEIREDNILWGLLELSVEVEQSELEVELNKIIPEHIDCIAEESRGYDFVITRDFSVNVAEGCHISGTPYISWCYDSPVRALYRDEALYSTNYVFVFDRCQLKRLKETGIEHVYYQPLAANMTKAELVNITIDDMKDYKSQISFVGGMYDKGFYEKFMERSSADVTNECEAILSEHLCKWTDETVFDILSDGAIRSLSSLMDKNEDEKLSISDRYLTELLVLVPELTFRERFRVLDILGQRYHTVVHTRNEERYADRLSAEVRPPLDMLSDELYKTYAAASVNLNITMRSIESGLPQRIFDIMSIGGCVFSNYQDEAVALFEPDKEIVLFGSEEELLDKVRYYLTNDKKRMEICIGGYRRVKECYNYPVALKNMIARL